VEGIEEIEGAHTAWRLLSPLKITRERAGASNCRGREIVIFWKFREFTTLVPSYGHKETRGGSDSVQGPFHLIQQFFSVRLRQGFPFGAEFGRSSEGSREKGGAIRRSERKKAPRTLKKHDGAELPVSHGSLSPQQNPTVAQ
jgi:hypothetical protein